MHDRVIDALQVLHGTTDDPLARVAAAEVVKAWADAEQARALADASNAQPAFLDPTGRMLDPAAAEIAAALTWTTRTADDRIDLALHLRHHLPGVWQALADGRLDAGKARDITTGTCELDPAPRTGLADRAVAYATGHTRGQLRAWLARQLAQIDPAAAARRRRAAVKQRHVAVHPEPDGMATVRAHLSAEEAQAVWQALTDAAANIDGGVDAARADTFVALLTGQTVGTPVPVTVLQTATGPEIAGYGPISPAHAARLYHGAPTIRLTPPAPSPGYRPAPALARWVRAHHRHCRFPGCRRPATACDLDHIVAWPAGPTSPHNLAPLCRYHHRLKTHAGWHVTRLPDGRMRWTSPQGRTYYTHFHDP